MVGVELLTIGGWFAAPVIKSFLDKAQRYVGANYKWQKGGKEMVDELTRILLPCKATVEEVETIGIITNQAIADWLMMLKETVYDAEDVLDSIETKSMEYEGKKKNKVSKLASDVRIMVFSDKDQTSLKKVVARLKELRDQIPIIVPLAEINIKKKESQPRKNTNPRETNSQEVVLYGRQDELDLILEIIQSNSILETNSGSQSKSSKKGEQDDNYHGIVVIPIVGMGGVGKTALAQAVYNNDEVQQTFASKAWISVSNNFDVKLVMGKIYESFTENPLSDLTNRSLESISKNLSRIIKGVKFLIVLDDIDMSESHWDSIRKILSGGAPGSVVLITTQNHVFANWVVRNTVGAVGPIALSALDSGVFWELFEHFAFWNVAMSEETRKTLNTLGKKIADKLHGLPLAAKIIGNVLNSDPDENRWRDISESEWWDIPEGQTEILPSIGLGYEQLNPSLRRCFAYCSLFPRNSLIEKNRLVHMWIAHNFIQSDVPSKKKIEDIGRECFEELVRKSFFQRAWDNNSYVMHELMHELAVIVSSGECFYLGEGVAEIPKGIRHLAVDTNNLEAIKRIEIPKNLRSFLYFGCCKVEGIYYDVINKKISNLDSLRVLDLSYMCMESYPNPPSDIWNMQHLRFLDLSSTGTKRLTYDSSINLYHLQALYIHKCNFEKLPEGINKLINLRHLCAKEETIAQISGIGQLTNLQELSTFTVQDKKGHTIAELENLREIRGTLTIKNWENIKNKDEAKQAKLVNKEHLHSIHIIPNYTKRWRFSQEDLEILQELQPYKDIKDLRIESYLGFDFPNWIIHIGDCFRELNTLCLVSFVNVEVLPPLGELPSLKHLQIIKFDSVKLIDSYLYGKNPTVFPLLEVLVLDGLSKCEEWTSLRGVTEFFPCLSKLTIENSTLRKAPLNLFSSTLKELKIRNCKSLISVGNSIPSLSSITQLELYPFSASISLDPLNMPFLKNLNLEYCPELKIEGDLQSLTHLKFLKLVGCSKLFSQYSTRDQQKGKGLQVNQDAGLRSLTHIEADNCSLLSHEYHLILGSLPSLRVLKFSGITQCTNNQNLWFEKLTALKELHLTDLTDCSQNLVQLCKAYEGQDRQFISSILVIHIDDHTNHKDAVPRDASKMESMELRKRQISDAIGLQACASCGKIFELSDLVLRSWTRTWGRGLWDEISIF